MEREKEKRAWGRRKVASKIHLSGAFYSTMADKPVEEKINNKACRYQYLLVDSL